MRFHRLLLVTPYAPGRFFGGVRPPVGLGYVEETLRASGVQVTALDMALGAGLRRLLREVESSKAELVGFTWMTYQYRHTARIMSAVKRHLPMVKIVVGGPHVCALGRRVFEHCDAVDFAVDGEGEHPMRDLCRGRPLAEIPGLHYRVDGSSESGPARRPPQCLDDLPFPRYRSYPLHRYSGELELITSRGCPHECIFCAVPSVLGRRHRCRSVENVLEEMRYFHSRGVRAFQLGDDNFLADRGHAMSILDAIARAGLKGLLLRCGQGIRGDRLDGEILAAMRRAGIRQIGIGVESGSEHVLKNLCKAAPLARIERGIALACESGLDVTLTFVVGAPGETLADVQASIDLAEKYPVMKAFFFNLIPFPGTRLYEWVEERRLFLGLYDDLVNRKNEMKLRSEPLFATPEMSASQRILAMAMTERTSKRIQVRTLRRKLSILGPLAGPVARAGRSDHLERWFVTHRMLRLIANRILFRRPGGDQSASQRPGEPPRFGSL